MGIKLTTVSLLTVLIGIRFGVEVHGSLVNMIQGKPDLCKGHMENHVSDVKITSWPHECDNLCVNTPSVSHSSGPERPVDVFSLERRWRLIAPWDTRLLSGSKWASSPGDATSPTQSCSQKETAGSTMPLFVYRIMKSCTLQSHQMQEKLGLNLSHFRKINLIIHCVVQTQGTASHNLMQLNWMDYLSAVFKNIVV